MSARARQAEGYSGTPQKHKEGKAASAEDKEEAKKALENVAKVAGVKPKTEDAEDGFAVVGLEEIKDNPDMASKMWRDILTKLIKDGREYVVFLYPSKPDMDSPYFGQQTEAGCDKTYEQVHVGLGWDGWELAWKIIHELLHIDLYWGAYEAALWLAGANPSDEEKDKADAAGVQATADDAGKPPPAGAVKAENEVRKEVGHKHDDDPQKSEVRHHHADPGAAIGPKPKPARTGVK